MTKEKIAGLLHRPLHVKFMDGTFHLVVFCSMTTTGVVSIDDVSGNTIEETMFSLDMFDISGTIADKEIVYITQEINNVEKFFSNIKEINEESFDDISEALQKSLMIMSEQYQETMEEYNQITRNVSRIGTNLKKCFEIVSPDVMVDKNKLVSIEISDIISGNKVPISIVHMAKLHEIIDSCIDAKWNDKKEPTEDSVKSLGNAIQFSIIEKFAAEYTVDSVSVDYDLLAKYLKNRKED